VDNAHFGIRDSFLPWPVGMIRATSGQGRFYPPITLTLSNLMSERAELQKPAVPRRIYLKGGDIVTFYDPRFPPDPGSNIAGEQPVNRVAVVVGEEGALFVARNKIKVRRVFSIPLDQILSLPNATIGQSTHAEHAALIARYFIANAGRPSQFEAGMNALYHGNMRLFEVGSLFPPKPIYQNDQDYDVAWSLMKDQLEAADCIFTTDLNHPVSRFIAWATHGPWSHCAFHLGSGLISESTLSGIREGPIEMYKGRQYRVAIYRHVQAGMKRNFIPSARKNWGPGYNYPQALKHGLISFLGNHNASMAPNSWIFHGDLVFIGQA
jgi:hypothetical protein